MRVVDCRRVGQEDKHLRLRLARETMQFDAIAFRQGEWFERLSPGSRVDVAYHLEINEWNGNIKLQLNVQDLRMAGQRS